VRVEHGRGFAELRPASRGFHLDVEIDFASATIGRQRRAFDVDPATFRTEMSRARTFGFVSDVERLWKMWLCARIFARKLRRPRRRAHPQSRGPALRRRVRPPQGA